MSNGFGQLDPYECDHTVQAYTGEIGDDVADVGEHKALRCLGFPAYTQQSGENFYVNGNYLGVGSAKQYLNYDGHIGTDYQAKPSCISELP